MHYPCSARPHPWLQIYDEPSAPFDCEYYLILCQLLATSRSFWRPSNANVYGGTRPLCEPTVPCILHADGVGFLWVCAVFMAQLWHLPHASKCHHSILIFKKIYIFNEIPLSASWLFNFWRDFISTAESYRINAPRVINSIWNCLRQFVMDFIW